MTPRVLESVAPIEGSTGYSSSVKRLALQEARRILGHVHQRKAEAYAGWRYVVCDDPACVDHAPAR